MQQKFEISANGVTRFGLSTHPLANLFIPVPDLPVQRQIASFLDERVGEINQTIKRLNEQIIRLNEYRASLVYNIVTGKLKI